MTDTRRGNTVSLMLTQSEFSILEGCCLNTEMQADGSFSYTMSPIILEVGKNQQIVRRLIRKNTFVRRDYSLR